MSIKLNVAYSDIKSTVIAKNLSLQYNETNKNYRVFAVDGTILYQTEVWKAGHEPDGLDEAQNALDRADFEATYKNVSNKPVVPRTIEGIPKILQAVSPDDVSLFITGKQKAVTGTNVAANNTIDSAFTEEIQLQGMMIAVKDADDGDTIDVEVGYDPGTGWVSLKKFGEAVPMKGMAGWQEYNYKNNAVSKIPSNLKIRTRLNQANTATTKRVLVHYIVHK